MDKVHDKHDKVQDHTKDHGHGQNHAGDHGHGQDHTKDHGHGQNHAEDHGHGQDHTGDHGHDQDHAGDHGHGQDHAEDHNKKIIDEKTHGGGLIGWFNWRREIPNVPLVERMSDEIHDISHGYDAKPPHGHAHGHADHDGHAGHGHDEHGHHEALVAKGTGGHLALHGNTLHLVKGGFFGFCVGLLGLHGGHAHQTIKVSDISAIEFEKHGFLFHYVRFSYPGAPMESGNHLHDMMADNALLMSLFDNRSLYHLKERLEQIMEAERSHPPA